jgi:acyl transferase domain-containing protein/glutamate/tyrosine decarboxylase-like PLP-dependent enzyme/acyl carrier protein
VLADEDMRLTIDAWLAKGKYGKLLKLWVKGLSVDWHALHTEPKPRRISLPTYPFAKERYWVGPSARDVTNGAAAMLLPPLQRVESDSSAARFTARLSGDGAYLRPVHGERVLAEIAQLEMARAALEAGSFDGARADMRMEQVEWLQPVSVGAEGLELHIELFADDGARTGYQIYSESEAGERVIHSLGSALAQPIEEVAGRTDAKSSGTLLMQRTWESQPLEQAAAQSYEQHLVLLCGGSEWAGRVETEVMSALPHAQCVAIAGAGGVAERYRAAVLQALEMLQAVMRDQPKQDVLIQAVVGPASEDAVFAALAGLFKTARLEHPRLKGQVIRSDAQSPAELVTHLQDGAHVINEVELRYCHGDRQVRAWSELVTSNAATELPWRDGGVYLITGGAGGLGLIFAEEIARRVEDAVVVLAGRSELDEARRARLGAIGERGCRIEYRRVDVADAASVNALVASLCESYGGVSGILHAAGLLRDGFLLRKSAEQVDAVLSPKVAGVVNLDNATAGLTMDFMVLFASLSGTFGNVGQADYAAANAFLDHYAGYRNRLVEGGERWGRTMSVAWPLWRDGGMHLDVAALQQQREAGLLPLASASGLAAFYQAWAAGCEEVAVLSGELSRLRASVLGTAAESEHQPQDHELAPAIDPRLLIEKTLHRLKGLLVVQAGLRLEQIDEREPLESYGIDSVMIIHLNRRLKEVFGELSRTLLFEYPTLQGVAEHLAAEHGPACARWAGLDQPVPRVPMPAARAATSQRASLAVARARPARRSNGSAGQDREPIAIIGISGRYPGAENLEQYWDNLRAGKECIAELSEDRWPLQGFYHPDPDEAAAQGKSYSKWGGMLQGFAEFDPLFFNISPREAANIDPQERLFVQSAWEALEEAGYTREQLKLRHQSRVGVFAGITKTGFALYGPELRRQGRPEAPHTSFGSVANRVSYLLNLSGPSMPIDTMCSASLTAIHEACEHLYRDECELALAGGVNLYLHPHSYVELCGMRMLSAEGRCKSFGKGGDGFVPGEGVGVVLLKRLSKAIEDEDQIHAVIRGTSINHGGKTNGYTVPNPVAQKELVRTALAKAGVSARAVSYIEAHGTGTELGDPIEIAGLTQAFAQDTQETGFCAIGSVKSNIGHLEAAAGIAGVTKAVLQLKHRTLVPSLNCEELNPHIDFVKTPFVVQRTLMDWPRPIIESGGVSREHLRIAGISSFGAGGSNAHVVIEEYVAPAEAVRPSIAVSPAHPVLVVLSAKNAERLKEQAAQLVAAIERRALGDADLADIAYTLQVGREAMEHRLALTAASTTELTTKLQAYLSGASGIEEFYTGEVRRERDTLAVLADEDMRLTIDAWLAKGKYGKLLELWVKGLSVYWHALHTGTKPRRISLPTYPFAKERYWIDGAAKGDAAREPSPRERETANAPIAPDGDVRTAVTKWIGQLFNMPASDIDDETELTQYGLDSIGSAKLVNRINQAYGLQLAPAIFYQYPTLASVVQHLGETRAATPVQRADAPPAPAVEPLPAPEKSQRPELLPLSYAQERMLLLHRRSNVGSAYNIPMAFTLRGSLDDADLQASFTEVIRRHDSLRTRFATVDGVATQLIDPAPAFELPIFDLQHLSENERPSEARRVADELVRKPFDLEVAPLFRAGLIRLDPTEHWLVITAHHLISDGWSMELLIREIAAIYTARSLGLPSPLPELPLQYVDYAIWQKRQARGRMFQQQLSYWKDRLADAPVLNLPTDRPRPDPPSYRGAAARFHFPERDVAALRNLAQREGATLFMVLFAAFNVVAARLSGQDDIVIGTSVAGRGSLAVERVIGFFINIIALRTDLVGEPTLREAIGRVKQTALGAFAHQELPLARLETEIGSTRDLSREPLFRVLFGLQKVAPDAAHFLGLDAVPVHMANDTARRDQSFFMYETADGLHGTLEYATDLFDASTIDAMIGEFRSVLYRMIADPDCRISDIASAGAGGAAPAGMSATLDPADWRRFGVQAHRMLDDMIVYLERIRERPVWQSVPDDVRADFREPLPDGPTELAAVHDQFMHSILPFATGNAHPGFMGWVHGGGNADGMLAEMLAAGINANLGGRDHAPIEVERQIVQWARQLFGFPDSASGLFVTGTSIANMIAVLVARHAALGAEVRRAGVMAGGGDLAAYTSVAAHGCIAQAMDLCGIGTDRLRQIPVDGRHMIDIAALERAVAEDREQGLRPFLIVGTAGTVDIGAIDDLKALAAIAKHEAVWFHVDGAFGALGMLTPEIAPRLAGIEQADSLAFDFHKWGQVPYDAGFIMVRDGTQHRATFTTPAAYLRRETRGLAAGSPWFCDFGPDLSRGFRALKTWFTIKVHGAAQIGAVISKTCELARYLQQQIEDCPELELLAPVQLNIVCFRYRCADPDAINAAIVIDLQESGIAAPSTTILDGQLAIRAAIVNHRTEARDIDEMLAAILKFGRARLEERSDQTARDANWPDAAQ